MSKNLHSVPRKALDSLANAYWLAKNMALDAHCIAANTPFDLDRFYRLIDRDPFWIEACRALEPGMRAGVLTSATVAESIERRTRKAADE